MIIDSHVHVFPQAIQADRSDWVARDHTFGEIYANSKARIATADDLLRSMDRAGVDVALMQGFAWQDADDCRRHNDALLDAASRHPDRLLAYCTLNPADDPDAAAAEAQRCLDGGARGFGEVRPDSQGFAREWDCLAPVVAVAAAAKAPLLVHASEPVGHRYPGKGIMTPGLVYALCSAYPQATWILAHLGGGLPFYAAMPEVRETLRTTYVDTAAWPLLYGPEVFTALAATVGTERILFASDYPLQGQARSLERMRWLPVAPEDIVAMLGGNAAALLGLDSAG